MNTSKRCTWLELLTFQRISLRLEGILRITKHMLLVPNHTMYQCPLSGIVSMEDGQRRDVVVDRQYLTPLEEKALRDYVLHKAALGPFVTVKFLRYLTREIVRRRSFTFQPSTTNDEIQLSGKNWPQGFYKRNSDLRSRTLKSLE